MAATPSAYRARPPFQSPCARITPEAASPAGAQGALLGVVSAMAPRWAGETIMRCLDIIFGGLAVFLTVLTLNSAANWLNRRLDAGVERV